MSQRSKAPRSTIRELRKTGAARGKRGKMSHRELEREKLVRNMVNARWLDAEQAATKAQGALKVQEQGSPGRNVLRWVLGSGAFWVLIAGVVYAYSR